VATWTIKRDRSGETLVQLLKQQPVSWLDLWLQAARAARLVAAEHRAPWVKRVAVGTGAEGEPLVVVVVDQATASRRRELPVECNHFAVKVREEHAMVSIARRQPGMTSDELADIEERAGRGDMEGQYLAGCARHDDDNMELRSPGEALRWLNLAAAQGYGPAWRRLGYIAVIEEKNQAKGVELYTRAAEAGDVDGAISLASLLMGSVPAEPGVAAVQLNLNAAEHWARFAADKGNPGGMCLLASVLLRADFSGDREEGCGWFHRASSISFLRTLATLREEIQTGRMVLVLSNAYVAGEAPAFPFSTRSNRLVPGASIDELQRLARQSSLDAIHDLGVECFFDGDRRFARPPRGDGRSIKAAHGHFSFAGQRGHPLAAFSLGCLLVTEAGFMDLKEAAKYFAVAARHRVEGARDAQDWLDRWCRLEVIHPGPTKLSG
jgi:TPR repeat protein